MKPKREKRSPDFTLWFFGSILFAGAVLGCSVGWKIPSARQADIFAALSGTSAILLGVFGVWIGTIKIPAMDSLDGDVLRKAAEEVVVEARRFRVVYRGVLVSAACTLLVLAMHVIIPIAHAFDKSAALTLALRGGSFFVVAALVGLQVWVVLCAIAPMQSMKHKFSDLEAAAKHVLDTKPAQDESDG